MPENEDGAEVFVFEPGGDCCGICQSMEGTYDYRPSRPHPNCKCTIKRDGYCETAEWEVTDAQLETGYGSQGYFVMIYANIVVKCKDGSTHEKVISIDFTLDYLNFNEQHWDDKYDVMFDDLLYGEVCEVACDEAANYAAEVCPECSVA
jgi:hypothetical protein